MPASEIYLVRHAIAAERGEEWPDDSKRPLTERGIGRFGRELGVETPLNDALTALVKGLEASWT